MNKSKTLEEMQSILKEIIDKNKEFENELENELDNYKNTYKISVYLKNKKEFLPENFHNRFITFIENNSEERIVDFECKGITQIPNNYWISPFEVEVEENNISIGICYEFILNTSFKKIEKLKRFFEINKPSIQFVNIEIE